MLSKHRVWIAVVFGLVVIGVIYGVTHPRV